MMTAFDALAKRTSDSVIGPTAEWMISSVILLCGISLSASDERFHRTLHVALEDHLQSRFLPFGDIGKEILERRALRRCELAVANVEEPLFTQEPRRPLAFHDHQFVSCIRQPTETRAPLQALPDPPL